MKPILKLPDITVTREDLLLIAGPCSVESEEQLFAAAGEVRRAGYRFLRGGAFKPRTSPYSFQGLQEEGIRLLGMAKKEFGLKIVTEIVDIAHLDLYADTVDILQIGARNMSNFQFLKQLAKAGKPILLKRGIAATIEELLLAAEYLTSGGNPHVILCERGIRTFEKYTRSTLDLSAVPIVKKLSPLPIIVDPSHSCGRSDIIIPMALAALMAGADGLIVEIHPNPQKALCDGLQSLDFEQYREMVLKINRLRPYLRDVKQGKEADDEQRIPE
ncbi:3-deoxy-7-phosphoheptulonate synthase [bacterium]|nr:3-deoxy-7-phosphoheptulonate synthase [candidate division CSSED10-310 bacterium]